MRSYQHWRRSCLPPPLWIPAFAGMTRWVAGITGLAGATETHERDGKHSFSYQSLMPAGAGTPRYENWGCWLVEVSWVSLVPPLDSGFRRNDDWGAGMTKRGPAAFRHT